MTRAADVRFSLRGKLIFVPSLYQEFVHQHTPFLFHWPSWRCICMMSPLWTYSSPLLKLWILFVILPGTLSSPTYIYLLSHIPQGLMWHGHMHVCLTPRVRIHTRSLCHPQTVPALAFGSSFGQILFLSFVLFFIKLPWARTCVFHHTLLSHTIRCSR